MYLLLIYVKLIKNIKVTLYLLLYVTLILKKYIKFLNKKKVMYKYNVTLIFLLT